MYAVVRKFYGTWAVHRTMVRSGMGLHIAAALEHTGTVCTAIAGTRATRRGQFVLFTGAAIILTGARQLAADLCGDDNRYTMTSAMTTSVRVIYCVRT